MANIGAAELVSNSATEYKFHMEKLQAKLEELRLMCFPHQVRASELVVECIHHATEIEEVYDGEDASKRPETT